MPTPMASLKKRKVVKKKVKVESQIQNELDMLFDELPDVATPEPVEGSPFQRRGYVECIANTDLEEELSVGKTYRINELGAEDNLLNIQGDHGDHDDYPCKLFKSIDHGPFREQDQVHIQGYSDVEALAAKDFPEGFISGSSVGLIESATDTHAIVQFGSKHKFNCPNRNLKLYKRNIKVSMSPFKKGDRVRCLKDYEGLSCGSVYEILKSSNDVVVIDNDSGNNYPHTWFRAYNRNLSRKEKIKQEMKNKLNLEDHIRNAINGLSYEKWSPVKLLKIMKDKKLEGYDKVGVDDIKNVLSSMFRW